MGRKGIPKSGNQSKIKVEHILQPLNGSSGVVGQNLDQIGTSLVTSGLEGIFIKLLDAVLNTEIGLCSCESTVDTGCGFCGVATEEACDGQNGCKRETEEKNSPCLSKRRTFPPFK
jgi:hypothetical protein